MIFKHGLKNVFRAEWKSILFAVLILTLTLVLSLGVSVWVSIDSFLDDCNEEYHSIALFEYMGTEYPDEGTRDLGVEAAIAVLTPASIEKFPGVISWHSSQRALGYCEGFKNYGSTVYDQQFAALVVKYTGTSMQFSSCLVIDTLYSFRELDNTSIRIAADSVISMERNHYYLVAGRFIDGPSSYKYFSVGDIHSLAAAAAGVEFSDSDCFVDITSDDGGWRIPDDSNIPALAQSMAVINNHLLVTATSEISCLMPFNQQQLYISQGRQFLEEEYSSGAAVCILPEQVCTKLGLGLGESINLSLAVSDTAATMESYWLGTGFQYRDDFTIVGITNTLAEYGNYVFVPTSPLRELSSNHRGYTIGTALLNNGSADEFYEAVQAILPDRVIVNIYDQGYAAVASPFKDILSVAIIVTLVCGLLALAALLLFGYLFVYRQRDVSQLMIRLGAGKRRTRLYFLYGSGFIALFSSYIGALGGAILSGRVGVLVQSFAKDYSNFDANYSNGNLSIIRPLPYSPKLPVTPFFLVGLAVFALAMCSCLYFTQLSFATVGRKKKLHIHKMKTARSSLMRGGAVKYALLSIRRGGARTLASPLLTFMAALFLCQLVTTAASYETQQARIYEESTISGSLTDSRGLQTGQLAITGHPLNTLARSGYIENVSVTKSVIFDEHDLSAPFSFLNSFSLETYSARLERGAKLIFTNDIAAAPEFYYSSVGPQLSFLDGYDESVLSSACDERRIGDIGCLDYGDEWHCLVSTEYLEENELALGDTLLIEVFNGSYWSLINFKIIGSFNKQGTKDNIYAELALYFDTQYMFSDDPQVLQRLTYVSFYSASFTLRDSTKLTEFKQFLLDEGFSEPNSFRPNRSFVVLQDKSFLATVGTIRQQIEYIGVLYPILYALTCAIGFICAYLLVLSRKRELAIMRSMGANSVKAIMSLFLEQMTLCLGGCVLGLILALALGRLTGFGAALTCLFVLCWIVGSAGAAVGMSSHAVLRILREED